jgi:hypothetical protein
VDSKLMKTNERKKVDFVPVDQVMETVGTLKVLGTQTFFYH